MPFAGVLRVFKRIVRARLPAFCRRQARLFVAYFSLRLKVDIILVGIAINLVGTGLTGFLIYVLTGDRSTTTSLQSGVLPQISIPGIQDIPILGSVLLGHNVLTYVSYMVVAVISFLLYKTSLGLRIRAVGENPDAARSVGVSVNRTKTIALAISGRWEVLAARSCLWHICPILQRE